jgi:TolB protein
MRALRPSLLLAVCGALVVVSGAQDGGIGDFESHSDVGSPKITGTATYIPGVREYTLMAGGANMWGARDEFHFVWKRMKGDFSLHASVQLVGKGVNAHRKAGWMIRSTQDEDSPYVDGVLHGDGLTSLQFRRTKAGITEERPVNLKAPDVLQLERKGSVYTLSAAKSGEPSSTSEIADVNLGDEVFVGLVLCSHDAEVMERAIFRDVRITALPR